MIIKPPLFTMLIRGQAVFSQIRENIGGQATVGTGQEESGEGWDVDLSATFSVVK